MPRGFILHPTYRLESGQPIVQLWGVLESGESFLVRDGRPVPRFHIRVEHAERARELGANVRDEDEGLVTMRGESVVRVEMRKPGETPAIRDRLAGAGIPTFEADVRFAYRYLIDRDIRGSVRIEGDSRPDRGVDRLFVDPEVTPGDWAPELRVLSLDIETDPEARSLLSIALHGCGASDVLLLTPAGYSAPAGAVACPDERELLRAFVRRVRELDPDVLTGWNVVDFDLAVLSRIAERRRVPLAIGRDSEPLWLRASLSPRAEQEARVSGRVVLDGIELVRGAFLRFESYSLGAVAQEVLGEGKTITGAGREHAREILRTFHEDRTRLVEYNRADARLALEILESLRLVELAVERSRLTGMAPDRVSASVASFDFLYLSQLRKRRIVGPTVRVREDLRELGGGHVLEPTPGLYRNVIVLDFKSLYPSLIRTFEIDPLGHVPEPDPDEDLIIAPNGAAFRREPGILPGIIGELFPRREAAKAAGHGPASQAIKILMNSFYGVLGTPGCRFASAELANAITSFGREVLLWSRDRIESRGWRVLYGDTDSLFVDSGQPDPEAARALGAELVVDLNRELADWVNDRWRVASRLELEFERLYLRLLLPVARGGSVGARKRYAGLVAEEGARRVVFTGMEAVRRDWTELAKRVQRELYDRLFTDRPVEELLHDFVADLREGRFDEDLVYRKALRKRVEDYTASTPPHVAAARKMSTKPGRIIFYVITQNGPEPTSERESPLDHEHYVQKQVRAVAEPVLTLLGLDFDEIVGDDAQLKLF